MVSPPFEEYRRARKNECVIIGRRLQPLVDERKRFAKTAVGRQSMCALRRIRIAGVGRGRADIRCSADFHRIRVDVRCLLGASFGAGFVAMPSLFLTRESVVMCRTVHSRRIRRVAHSIRSHPSIAVWDSDSFGTPSSVTDFRPENTSTSRPLKLARLNIGASIRQHT